MDTQFFIVKDNGGTPSYLLTFPNINYNASLTMDTELTLTAPGTYPYWAVVFRPQIGGNLYVALNESVASIGPAFALSSTMLNVPGVRISALDVIHILTPDPTLALNVSFYGKTRLE